MSQLRFVSRYVFTSRRPRAGIAAAVLLAAISFGCGPAGPPPPGKTAFDAADNLINTDKNGHAFGNTDEARRMADAFSKLLAEKETEVFTGGKEGMISLTGKKFLTYCQVNGKRVAFLVHVPQFKQYKDDVRDALITIAWAVAHRVIEDEGPNGVQQVGVGLRGTLFYGGLAIGPAYQDPAITENAGLVDFGQLYEFFASPTTASSPAAVPSQAN